MRDDYLGLEWASGHHHVSAALHKAIKAIGVSFDRLNAYQFDAPWRRPGRARTSAGR